MYWIMWGLVDRALYNALNPPPVPEAVPASDASALPAPDAPPGLPVPGHAQNYR
jgi:hypothetical protein